jgi:hypothetical protein
MPSKTSSWAAIIFAARTPLGLAALVVLALAEISLILRPGKDGGVNSGTVTAVTIIAYLIAAVFTIVVIVSWARPEALLPPGERLPKFEKPATVVNNPTVLYANGWNWGTNNPFEPQLVALETQVIEKAFPARLARLVDSTNTQEATERSTVQNLRSVLTTKKYSIVHLTADADQDGALQFDRPYPADALAADIKEAGAKLVVLSNCDSLALCARITQEGKASVIAVPTRLSADRVDSWERLFYEGLAEGRTLRDAYDRASRDIKEAWICLMPTEDVRFVLPT